jgi:hydrogenase expression/formation protein HypE
VTNHPLQPGKLAVALLTELLAEIPAAPPEILVGPSMGEDACAIEIPNGVLIVSTDPITLSSTDLGRLAVIINANDVAVTGGRPRWFLAVCLVPPATDESVVRGLFEAVRGAVAEVGAVLVGGHTEVTSVVARPIVVGQMLGLADDGKVIATGGVTVGSVVVQVGPTPVEAAALLAREAVERLGELDADVLAAAQGAFEHPGISVVDPALLAARLGAIALHDPTEGGLAAGLHELAHASGVLIRIDRKSVLWFEPGVAVCRALGADPWAALSSGTLLAAFSADIADSAVRAITASGHPAAAIGRAEPGSGVQDDEGRPIPWPDRDEVGRFLP